MKKPSDTKNSLKILLGRITSQYIDSSSWMNSIISKHIPHELQDTSSSKSSVYWMGVLLKNEASYSDCIQTMDEYENLNGTPSQEEVILIISEILIFIQSLINLIFVHCPI